MVVISWGFRTKVFDINPVMVMVEGVIFFHLFFHLTFCHCFLSFRYFFRLEVFHNNSFVIMHLKSLTLQRFWYRIRNCYENSLQYFMQVRTKFPCFVQLMSLFFCTAFVLNIGFDLLNDTLVCVNLKKPKTRVLTLVFYKRENSFMTFHVIFKNDKKDS